MSSSEQTGAHIAPSSPDNHSLPSTPTPAVLETPYGYVPTRNVQIVFLVLFSLAMFAHLAQGLRSRLQWLLPTVVLCGLLEVLTFSVRLWSSFHPSVKMLYTTQFVLGLIAPTHLIAALVIIFRVIMGILGFSYSNLGSKMYTKIFFGAALVSLAVQGGSGGLTAINSKPNIIKIGGYLALAGTIIQTLTIVAFLVFVILYFVRYTNDRPSEFAKLEAGREALPGRAELHSGVRWMSIAVIISSTLLLVRGLFRIIELAGGLDGKISRTQIYYVIFDSSLVFLALITLNVTHPANLLSASDK